MASKTVIRPITDVSSAFTSWLTGAFDFLFTSHFFVHIVVLINYTGPLLIPAYPLSTCLLRDVNSENLIEGVLIATNG